jgi:serine/threonine-protein kinase
MGAPLRHEEVSVHEGTATIKTLVVTDLVDSTRLLATVGDRRAAELSARHDRVARDLLMRCGGREIDKTDGFLLVFERTVDAVRFALAYHRELAALSSEEGQELVARVGIHLGEVILRSNSPEDVARGAKPVEIEGYAKPIAARVMALAEGRQTLLTRGAFDLARQAAAREPVAQGELRWLAHGPYVLKGVTEPVEVFEVGEKDFAPLLVPKSTAKARRAVSAAEELTLGWRPAPGLEIPRRPRWRLVEKLGEGGFGEVWRGLHEKTGENRVFKFCYQPDRLRSLQREVTLFRLLKETLGSRDDIARILDWNFDEAPYFLECEYTEGGNLIEWVRDQGGPSEVQLATRLELMAQVAEALAAAHSVGVLHKDVKPSNVLVRAGADGHPRVRLTDFGIGLITDREALARQGITVFDLTEMVADTSSAGGTHLYMAPELVEGRNATVQADIYALGVMLYQFVAEDFSRALAPGWRRDVTDEVLQEDVAALVDGRPERRMRDAQRVAERLRTLDERRAKREAERREREEREAERLALDRAHRRRRLSAAIAAISLAVLAIVSYLALQAVEARREAERRRGQAESLIGFMVGDLRGKLEPIGRLDLLDEIGDQALQYFESVPEDQLTDEELFRRSETLRQIGDVRVSRGNLAEALDAYRQSLAGAAALVTRDPANGEWQKALGASHFGVGLIFWRQNELKEAQREFQVYLAIAQELAARNPNDPEWQMEVAYAHSNIGSIQQAQGHLEEARDAFAFSLEVRQRLMAAGPADDGKLLDLSNAYNKLGSAEEALGDLASALHHYEADLEIKRRLVEDQPANTLYQQLLATAHHFLGIFLESADDLDAAADHFRTAERIAERLVDFDPTNLRWRRDLAIHRSRLAQALQLQGRVSEAREEADAAVAQLEDLVTQDPIDYRWRRDLALGRLQAAEVRLAGKQPRQARQELERATDLLSSLLEEQPDNRDVARLLSSGHTLAGRAWAEEGERPEAEAEWRRAVDLIQPIATGSNDKLYLEAWARPLILLADHRAGEIALAKLQKLGFRRRDFVTLCRDHGFLYAPIMLTQEDGWEPST